MNVMDLVKENEAYTIECRRFLHQIPELGNNLPNTFKFVCEKLEEIGVDFETGVGIEHGIVVLIDSGKPGKTIAFRGDMDGLPVKEDTGLPFESKNGCMHACGHDAHTAMLLTTIKIIFENKDKLNGRFLFIFQPGEEVSLGAKPIAESGIFEKYKVEEIYGLHVGGIGSGKENGKIFFSPGPLMACLDKFNIKIIGKGSHGAYPDKSIDPITISAYIITALQEIISREINPIKPSVITIGQIHGGDTYNVIPTHVQIEGTARSVTEEQREYVANRIGQISKSVAEAFRGSVEYDYTYGAPPLVNSPDITEKAIKSAEKIFDKENIVITNDPVMGGEDFAEYLKFIPGSFIFLENMLPIDGEIYPHHNPKFAIDESKFIYGVGLFVQIAFDN